MIKKILAVLGFIIGLLTLGFLSERNKRKATETKLENADIKKDDAVANQKIEDLKQNFEEEKAKIEAEKTKTMTDEELVDFFKKK